MKLPARLLRRLLPPIFLLIWATWIFVLDYRFALPEREAWCLFGPAMGAGFPLALKTPLLGSFLGADHAWCLHWPGVPLIESCLLPLLSWLSPVAARITLMLFFQAAAAFLTYRLIRSYIGSAWIGLGAAAIILADRDFLNAVSLARPEPLTCVVLLVYMLQMSNGANLVRTNGAAMIAAGCMFLFPWVHPVMLSIGFILCAYAFWRARHLGASWLCSLRMPAAYGAGLIAFASWLWFHRVAWPQFRDHASMNWAFFGPQGTFLPFLRLATHTFDGVSFPLYSPLFVYLAALGLCVVMVISRGWWSTPPLLVEDGSSTLHEGGAQTLDWALPLVTIASAMALTVVQPDPIYPLVVLPEAVLLAAAFFVLAARRLRLPVIAAPCSALLLLACYHGLTFITRFEKLARAGYPNLTAEARRIFEGIPAANHVFIPELLWEDAIRHPSGFLMNTLPQTSSPAMRSAYESYIYAQAQPGDVLIVDRFNSHPIDNPPDLTGWDLIQHHEHVFHHRVDWGYDVDVYRMR